MDVVKKMDVRVVSQMAADTATDALDEAESSGLRLLLWG